VNNPSLTVKVDNLARDFGVFDTAMKENQDNFEENLPDSFVFRCHDFGLPRGGRLKLCGM
jgi:hypothetical protein